MKKHRVVAALLLCALLLTGCASPMVVDEPQEAVLPDTLEQLAVPEEHDDLDRVVEQTLYLPDTAMRRLVPVPTRITETFGRSAVSQMAQSLLFHQGNADTRSISGGNQITLYGASPVAVAGGVCTVNLSAAALALSEEELYTAAMSLTDTLCTLEDIDHVVVLIADQAPGMDIMGNLPMGALEGGRPLGIDEAWDQLNARRAQIGEDPSRVPVTASAALYYPTRDGSGVTPMVRELTFAGQSPQQLTDQLLRALQGEDGPEGTAALTVLGDILMDTPEASDRIEGGRLITLRFREDWETACWQSELEPEQVLAAVVLTVTGFVPSVPAVEVLVNGMPIESAGNLAIEDDVLRPTDFVSMLREITAIRLPQEDGLVETLRTTAPGMRHSPRTLLNLLLDGLVPALDDPRMTAALPRGLDDSDILAIGLDGDTMVINLSTRFAEALSQLDAAQERMAAYAMTHTLCRMCGISRVAFRFDGDAVENLGGAVDWAGIFMEIPALDEWG